MATKIGRNDPCPCGSGKKYKQCCGRGDAAQEVAPDSHEYAVARAMAWLGQNHQKAFGTALAMALGDAIEGLFADDEQTQEALAGIDQELWTQIQINLTEWLLAEGDIEMKGEFQRVADLLQGPRGPLLSVEQRAWLAQLAQRPLRLYDVTDVAPGATLTLCDALDRDADPVIVTERSGSRTLRPGMCIGARLMTVDGQHQLSGAVYPFSRLGAQATLRTLLAGEDEDFEASDEDPSERAEPDDDPMLTGLTIIDCWLEQLLLPPMIPDIVDASTGDPLVPTTDHYDVSDWSALATALAAQSDVDGDRTAGWSRLREDAAVMVPLAASPQGSAVGRVGATGFFHLEPDDRRRNDAAEIEGRISAHNVALFDDSKSVCQCDRRSVEKVVIGGAAGSDGAGELQSERRVLYRDL